jgi:hypothetical protein
MKSTVSLVTITQKSRFESIKFLEQMVNYQTYENIIEWIIVEGSKSEEDGKINSQNISTLQSRIPINYIKWTGKKLGGLRQLSNEKAKGDIIVCMDDDDFYPKTRVEHAVDELTKSSYLIAGASKILCYDFVLDKFLLYNNFNPKHSTNNIMAYKKEYLINHKYDESREFAEEHSFTNGYSEPMIQLDTYKTIILISHKLNTYNKREIFINGLNKMSNNISVEEVEENINKYIYSEMFDEMKKLYIDLNQNKYDIIYFTGGFCIQWDPEFKGLGGSEQSVVHLSEEWVKLGKSVCVYGNFQNEKEYNGVSYRKWQNFNYQLEYNVVILWRLYGMISAAPIGIKCKHLYLDLHDNMKNNKQFKNCWNRFKSFSNQIELVFFKSKYHRNEFFSSIGNVNYKIIMNGVRTNYFTKNIYDVTRDKYRFCYCSAYTRGLFEILQHVWPIIYQAEPRAELHVYYGLPDKIKNDPNLSILFSKLLSQPGVMDHGKQSVVTVAREKYRSNFQLYLTNTEEEIDCISIRESYMTGCIPIISNFGVFKERPGIHIDYDVKNVESMKLAGKKICSFFKQDQHCDNIRELLRKTKMTSNWNDIAKEWLSFL